MNDNRYELIEEMLQTRRTIATWVEALLAEDRLLDSEIKRVREILREDDHRQWGEQDDCHFGQERIG